MSDLHAAISGMWSGRSPCLLKVTLIHSPSRWPDYIMRMCFITSLLTTTRLPSLTSTFASPLLWGLGLSHQQNMQPLRVWEQAERLHLEKHQRSGFELRPYPYTPIVSCSHTNAETRHISKEGKELGIRGPCPGSDPSIGEELHLK